MTRTFIFRSTEFNGDWSELRFDGCTHKEAIYRAFDLGWTPPKWWQWWRWGDYPKNSIVID